MQFYKIEEAKKYYVNLYQMSHALPPWLFETL
nr:MAG TPA: hypothetical protein [Caudoviricetes sp.]